MTGPKPSSELRETLRMSAVLSSLETLVKYETDAELKKLARRRYLELSDQRNITDLEAHRG